MMKKNKVFNLLKTMLRTSYDTTNLINKDTRKLNKKSLRVWLIGIVLIIVIYLTYILMNLLKDVNYPEMFLEVFFIALQILVTFQTILLVISVLYFSNDIENYLSLPISSTKLLINKFAVLMSIIFGSEAIILIPSIIIYGVTTLQDFLFYPLALILIILISTFLSTLVSTLMIFVMKILKFIRNKNLYRNIVILVMSFIIFLPLMNIFNMKTNDFYNVQTVEQEHNEENKPEETDSIKELKSIVQNIKHTNKYFIVTEMGVQALSNINFDSLLYVLKILALNVLILSIFLTIEKFTYIKDVLWSLSIFDKKKNKKIRLYKKCKAKNKKYAYIKNEIKLIIKNSTYFMHYIYNLLILLLSITIISTTIIPIMIQAIKDTGGEEIFKQLSFEIGQFSIIIGIIQVIFTLSSLSLTAISRYGKNAIFFKYIPMGYRTQFRLKNIPQIIMNTIIIVTILGIVHYLIPAIDNIYILSMFVVSMLLNIINSNTLLLLDLLRPNLNYEDEITVIKQNDNKLFQYILTVGLCLIIWYLNEVTKEIDFNIAILVEIITFSIIVIVMEIFINKKAKKLFKKII